MDTVEFSEALRQAVEAAKPVNRVETVFLERALGRVTAEEIICRKNLPSFDNSAMDGFALRHSDAGKRLRVAGTILAGEKREPSLREGECYRIMTGAQVPSDADTIVPIEACELHEEMVTVPSSLRVGANLRRRGEEQELGGVLIEAGTRLRPSHIAMLAAQGITALKVYAPLRIAILSTGNEIREPWELASEDEIYNANASAATALLQKFGFQPVYLGSLPDEPEKIAQAVAEFRAYDVVISSGGISAGEADFLEEIFVSEGLEWIVHGVRVKPGHPSKIGQMDSTLVFALPGNPLATILNLHLLGLPALFRMQGMQDPYFPFVWAETEESFAMKSHRSNLVLGRMYEGRFRAVRDNRVGSGMLTPWMESDCVAVFGEGVEAPKAGERIRVIRFDAEPSEAENRAFNLSRV